MNSASHLRSHDAGSCLTFESVVEPGVSFRIRRMTLRHRINLIQELHTLYREHEFGSAGTSTEDRLRAQLSSLRIDEVFLRWGVVDVAGLQVDGKPIGASDLVDYAPEKLAAEILGRIRETIALSPDEEKN